MSKTDRHPETRPDPPPPPSPPLVSTAGQGPYRGLEGETFSCEWQDIDRGCIRLRVYGGWLVRYSGYNAGGLCFVQDHDGRWVLRED
jgi:hypothetical protein